MVVGFLGFGFFSVGFADVNMHKLIHWSCRVSLVHARRQHCCSLAGWAADTTTSEMH